MPTLLERALADPGQTGDRRRKTPSPEEIELAIAYFKGIITAKQIARVMGKTSRQNTYIWCSSKLAQAVRMGWELTPPGQITRRR